jgi:hypothetical protein
MNWNPAAWRMAPITRRARSPLRARHGFWQTGSPKAEVFRGRLSEGGSLQSIRALNGYRTKDLVWLCNREVIAAQDRARELATEDGFPSPMHDTIKAIPYGNPT